MPPSRQERRKAERDAAKRAPARSGAGGAGGAAAARAAGAAAALANLTVNPLGDWTTQAEDPYVEPVGHRLARHVIGCPLTIETSVQNSRGERHAWPDPSARVDALGVEVVKQREAMGDGAAQFSQGCLLVSRADGNVGFMGASGIAHGGCRVCTLQLHDSSLSPNRGASMRSPDHMICLRVPTLC